MEAVLVKSATGAHIGTGTWLVQRATAVVLAVALPGLIIRFLAALPLDFPGWQALFAPLWVRVMLMLTMTALALHAWVGMRDIFMDYIQPVSLRLAFYLAVIVTLAGCEIVMLMVLWK
jgi:succinate dehydrogenase / fumarate reductase membrane anchor subunit